VPTRTARARKRKWPVAYIMAVGLANSLDSALNTDTFSCVRSIIIVRVDSILTMVHPTAAANSGSQGRGLIYKYLTLLLL
jgi:hypothetical protein